MNGFLGTTALFPADLALVLSWVLGLTAVGAWALARRRRFPPHCRIMAVTALLNWLPVLIVMIPVWVGLWGSIGRIAETRLFPPLMHGLIGLVSQSLMTYTVVRMNWLKRLPPRNTRWLMRITLLLWLLTVIGGTAIYGLLYVL